MTDSVTCIDSSPGLIFFVCSLLGALVRNSLHCIFCREVLQGRGSWEHILLNAFGGKAKTKTLSCAMCNNKLGGTIDRELAEQFTLVRNLFEMVSGDGRDAPSLYKVQAGNRKINLLGNGRVTLAGRPFTVEELGGGQFRVAINVQSLDELEAVIPHIVAKTGIAEDRLREQLAGAQFTDTQDRPGIISHKYSLGGEGAMRAVAKACLLLWGRTLGNEEAQKPEYDEVRSFIRNGSADFLSARTFLDSRPLARADEVEKAYGPLFNFVGVTSDARGKVVGHFTVYNLLGFQVVLAEGGAAPCKTVSLANNPLDPKIWSDKADKVGSLLDADWLAVPSFETDEYRRRSVAMMESYYRIIGARAVGRIVDRVCARYGFAGDDPIPPEMLNLIQEEIAVRVAHNIAGLPLTIPVSPEEIAGSVRKAKKGEPTS
ncbi:HNH endonuclease [Bosea sp. TND4EK4]|uniref:HNH endonuclease n=1 Tax=Bosea sp. TND4EK4 TaxID=1907408 RepID=UPI00158AD239|nr:HNH endonuclease [Bosea sp. TND4EK4]